MLSLLKQIKLKSETEAPFSIKIEVEEDKYSYFLVHMEITNESCRIKMKTMNSNAL